LPIRWILQKNNAELLIFNNHLLRTLQKKNGVRDIFQNNPAEKRNPWPEKGNQMGDME
jgi:hypothetical protein